MVCLLVALFTRDKICEHLGFGQSTYHEVSIKPPIQPEDSIEKEVSPENDYFVDDNIYRWDDELIDWVMTEQTQGFQAQLVNTSAVNHPMSKPIEVDWKVLMDIEYRLKYFAEIDMEMYAPVFPEAVKALNGKEVIIEGFVIPFDEEGEFLSLSYNPYASCFFCGKASPASVISMYLKDKRKRYKMDDFKKFKGTLHLNHDDPDEFYYILRNAKEVKE